MKLLIFLLPLLPLFAQSQQVDTIVFKFSNGDIKYLVARGGVGTGTDSIYVQHNGVRTVLSPMDLPISTAAQAALDGKQATLVNQTNIKSVNNNSLLGSGNIDISSAVAWGNVTGTLSNQTDLQTAITARGYTLSVQALTSSPADGATIYFGQLPKAPVTAAATSKVFIRKSGTIKAANIYCFSGTAGTNEVWVAHIRLNNTTDTQIASVSLATGERVWSNTGLSIAVVAGDYIEIKFVNPTWSVNPLTCILGGYIYIE